MTPLPRWIASCGVVLVTALGTPVNAGAPTLTATQLARLDLRSYATPMVPPDFSLRTSEGRVVSLTSVRGKVVLLNFWATWCRECLTEMPGIEQLHRRFGGRGLAVVGIDTREGEAAVRRYAKDLGLTFPLGLDPDGAVTARYGVIGLPTTFLIGRDGRAVALAVGPREWTSPAALEIVEALLGEP